MKKDNNQILDLLKVLEISNQLALNQNLQVLLKQIEQAAVEVLSCEKATVFVYDQVLDELYSIVDDRSEKLYIPANSGIAGNCFKSRMLINVQDAYQDPRFNRSIDRRSGFKTRNILAAPMVGNSQDSLGVLEVINKKGGSFNEWDQFLLEVLSGQCGIALHRHALIQEFGESKRMQQELAIARSIQQSLLPTSAPIIAGYDIAGWNQSAQETGGDFYDFHLLEDGKLILILADVSGHGIGPALLAAECWALQRAAFSWAEDYGSCMDRINRLICRHIPNDRFITAFIGNMDAENDTLTYLSAGHGPVFILKVSEHRIENLPVRSMPLGIMAEHCYDQWQTASFNPGDILIAFTDGFFEWENASGNNYGTERICETVFRCAHLSAAAIIERVHHDLLRFADGIRQQDDLTAIVVKKLTDIQLAIL